MSVFPPSGFAVGDAPAARDTGSELFQASQLFQRLFQRLSSASWVPRGAASRTTMVGDETN